MGRAVQLSEEFRLAIECCRQSFANCDAAGISHTAKIGSIDWSRFQQLVRFHRIEGLAWNGLESIQIDTPGKVQGALLAAAKKTAGHNLRTSLECRELLGRFDRAAIPVLFLKGLTLGALAYGDPALKSAIDVDLLIDPADLGRAANELRAAGYQLVVPSDRGGEALFAWHRRSKESVWLHNQTGTQIDLHTRTADNPRLIPDIKVHSPRQSVEIGGGLSLPTLAADELFAYLAVHGTATVWFRLKWISDFAGLVHGKEIDEIGHLYRRSQLLGAGRTAAQALLLADALFGTLGQHPSLRDELLRDRANRILLGTALRRISGSIIEPTEHLFGTSPMHWTPFLFRSGGAYWLSELSAQGGRLINRLRA